MMEWIRFGVTAFFLLTGLIAFAAAVLGANKFGYAMNRVHAAGIGDTFGIFCIAMGLIVSSDQVMDALKILLLLFFLWFSSPASTHLLGQLEFYSNRDFWENARKKED